MDYKAKLIEILSEKNFEENMKKINKLDDNASKKLLSEIEKYYKTKMPATPLIRIKKLIVNDKSIGYELELINFVISGFSL